MASLLCALLSSLNFMFGFFVRPHILAGFSTQGSGFCKLAGCRIRVLGFQAYLNVVMRVNQAESNIGSEIEAWSSKHCPLGCELFWHLNL